MMDRARLQEMQLDLVRSGHDQLQECSRWLDGALRLLGGDSPSTPNSGDAVEYVLQQYGVDADDADESFSDDAGDSIWSQEELDRQCYEVALNIVRAAQDSMPILAGTASDGMALLSGQAADEVRGLEQGVEQMRERAAEVLRRVDEHGKSKGLGDGGQ